MDARTTSKLEFFKSIIFMLLIEYLTRLRALLLFSGIC
jgi:hypothetical protein